MCSAEGLACCRQVCVLYRCVFLKFEVNTIVGSLHRLLCDPQGSGDRMSMRSETWNRKQETDIIVCSKCRSRDSFSFPLALVLALLGDWRSIQSLASLSTNPAILVRNQTRACATDLYSRQGWVHIL